MSQIMPDSGTDNAGRGLVPTDAGAQALNFQAHEGLYRHPDVTPLRLSLPRLALLHPATLLQPPVVLLYPPSLAFQLLLLLRGHSRVIGGPVFHVSVWGDRPETP